MSKENYEELTKDELITRLKASDALIEQVQKTVDKEELTRFPWVGNLGQWNWILPNNTLVFNEKKATNLDYRKEEIPKEIGFEFFTNKLHPDDYDQVMNNMHQHLIGETQAYETEYRIKKKDGSYAWYYDRGTVAKRDTDGKALLVSGIVFDISHQKLIQKKLRKANEQLLHLSRIDDLTSAYNKRFMHQCITEEMNKLAKEKDYLISLMMIDIDNFKQVNDQFGHQKGDRLLKYLYKTIKKELKSTDLISRWGGDEFLVLLKNQSIKEIKNRAEKIRLSFKKQQNNKMNFVSLSIGITQFKNKTKLESAIKLVDQAMYQAKSSGKDQVNF